VRLLVTIGTLPHTGSRPPAIVAAVAVSSAAIRVPALLLLLRSAAPVLALSRAGRSLLRVLAVAVHFLSIGRRCVLRRALRVLSHGSVRLALVATAAATAAIRRPLAATRLGLAIAAGIRAAAGLPVAPPVVLL
jgi:hypothetical protein